MKMSEPWKNLDPLVKHWNKIMAWAGHRGPRVHRQESIPAVPRRKTAPGIPPSQHYLVSYNSILAWLCSFTLFGGYFIKPMDPSDRYTAKEWNKRRKNICYATERIKKKAIFCVETLETSGLYIYPCSLSSYFPEVKNGQLEAQGEVLERGVTFPDVWISWDWWWVWRKAEGSLGCKHVRFTFLGPKIKQPRAESWLFIMDKFLACSGGLHFKNEDNDQNFFTGGFENYVG